MIEIGGRQLALGDIEKIVFGNEPIVISNTAAHKIDQTYRAIVKCSTNSTPIYGINTGFGALAEVRIDAADQKELQKNIVLSHAVGIGDPLDFCIAKTMIALRINTLAQSYSGASPTLIRHLVHLLNNNCAPWIPKKGSVGASGDLAPLAHLGLLLLGIGDAFVDQELCSAQQALDHANLTPLSFGLRDGLALINGTQAMQACAFVGILECMHLATIADLAASCTLDALAGHAAPFDERIHHLKPHPGQLKTAFNIRKAIEGRTLHKHDINRRTQDQYSLRCVPQVHGATRDVISHVKEVVLRELNSVTDNPLIFLHDNQEDFDMRSGGNFHGQHLALTLDYLAMGMAELANIAERRLEILLNPHHSNGLPPFLMPQSGLHSGYMMLQVTAAALANENKVLCHPASVDSIPTSANREDHVSMGMTAANKLMQVIANTKTVLAIEMLAANQGLDFRPKDAFGYGVSKLHCSLREHVPFRTGDVLYRDDVMHTLAWLSSPTTKQLMKDIVGDDE